MNALAGVRSNVVHGVWHAWPALQHAAVQVMALFPTPVAPLVDGSDVIADAYVASGATFPSISPFLAWSIGVTFILTLAFAAKRVAKR